MAKPGLSLPPSTSAAESLDAELRRDPLVFPDPESMARFVGWSGRQLESAVRVHFHRGAEDHLRRRHLEHVAKRLLHTSSPVEAIAREHHRALGGDLANAFSCRFGLSPEAYRGLGRDQSITFRLPSWFHRQRTLAYLGRDPQSLTERVDGNRFTFATRLNDRVFPVRVELARSSARYFPGRLLGPNPADIARLHDRVLKALGLVIDPGPFESRRLPDLQRLVGELRGLSIPQTPTVFDGLVWVVVGQQVSLPVAFSLRRRLTEAYGDPCGDGLATLPAPGTVAALAPEDLRAVGFSRAKAEYLLGLARAVEAGTLDLATLGQRSACHIERELTSQRGLGACSPLAPSRAIPSIPCR